MQSFSFHSKLNWQAYDCASGPIVSNSVLDQRDAFLGVTESATRPTAMYGEPVRAYRSPLWLTRSLLPSSLGRSPSLRNASLILRHSIDNRRRRIRSPPPEPALPPSARFECHSSRICVRPENRPNCRASLPKCGRLLF